MIGMFTIMIDHGIGLRKLFGTVHPYPSYSQVVGFIADEFATRNVPQPSPRVVCTHQSQEHQPFQEVTGAVVTVRSEKALVQLVIGIGMVVLAWFPFAHCTEHTVDQIGRSASRM